MISLLDSYLINNSEEEKGQQLVSSVSRDASKILKMTTINISTIHHILQNKGIVLLLLSPPLPSVGNVHVREPSFCTCTLYTCICTHVHTCIISFPQDFGIVLMQLLVNGLSSCSKAFSHWLK